MGQSGRYIRARNRRYRKELLAFGYALIQAREWHEIDQLNAMLAEVREELVQASGREFRAADAERRYRV